MRYLKSEFPPKKQLVWFHLKNGEKFIGCYNDGGSGIGYISDENGKYDIEDGDYDQIEGWNYITENNGSRKI